MFDRLDLFREDTPTPTPARADAAPDERAHPRQDRDHPAPDDRDRHEPTWGSIVPCPTRTCPNSILTATPTRPGAW